MPESKRHDDFARQLLSQDPPRADKQLQHKNALFKKIKVRLWTEKIATGAIYLLLFLASVGASRQADRTQNLVHAICWTTVSAYILVWFGVYFLWRTGRLVRAITPDTVDPQAARRTKDDRWLDAGAIFICLFSTVMLCLSFTLDDPSRALGIARGTLWFSLIVLVTYLFPMASRLGKHWLAYRRMELGLDEPEECEPDDAEQ